MRQETGKRPAISVIVPVYNVEQYLRRCLDSLLNQTFDNWEAICVNDGSPDNSAAILDEYAARDKRFKVITQVNGGLSDARNTGMKHATGEYVLYLDSDDFIHPQTMEITYGLAKRDNSDIVSFRKNLFLRTQLVVKQFLTGNADKFIPVGINKRYDINHVLSKTTDDVFPYVTERSHRLKYLQIKHAYVWQNLYRRELIKDVPFIKGIIMEDFPWWSALWLKHPRVTITRLPFYYYMPNNVGILSAAKQSSAKRLRLINSMVVGIRETFTLYKKHATSREMEIWHREFLWPFTFWVFRKIRFLDNDTDRKTAAGLFAELNNMGAFDNPPYWRAHKYRRRILRFISQNA